MNPSPTILDEAYAERRKTSWALRYRLARRTREVVRGLAPLASLASPRILDVGCADGRMLTTLLNERFPRGLGIGAEYAPGLLQVASQLASNRLSLVRADAHQLPLKNESVDGVVATAVLEHLLFPAEAIAEWFRVLAGGGLLIITAPAPFWENLATKLGHLKAEQHHLVLGLSSIVDLVTLAGFKVITAHRFMCSPVGFPFERTIEKGMRTFGLGALLANQLVVAQKR